MTNILTNQKFSEYTTLEIGGPIKELAVVNDQEEMTDLLKEVEEKKSTYMVIAEGSDLLVGESGYDGLLIINRMSKVNLIDQGGVEALSGTKLQDFVDFANKNGLAGVENLAGIPGSVGGAIYGNAGAYGQTISDKLTSVNVFKSGDVVRMSKDECQFTYRESIFKKNKDWVILSATFELENGNASELTKKSLDTIELRSKKYPPGIKCPGSFFKNIIANNVSVDILKNIPEDKIVYGKIPAGYLLEEVGAKGDKLGEIEIADYHGNLFINTGKGSADDFFKLAKKWKQKVFEKFGIELEPEVQLIGFKEEL